MDRFLADWGGSIFAAVSIVCLFMKSLWYWYTSLASNALWFYLFVATSSLMVAGLQVSYAMFAVYGIARWSRERRGVSLSRSFDHLGSAIALGIFTATVAATTFATWPSYVEFAAVALSIVANWLTAMKIVWCWYVWMATNVLFAILFFHEALWGLFSTQFLFLGLSVIGIREWSRQRRVPLELEPVHA